MTQTEAVVAAETSAHVQKVSKASCIAVVSVANVSSCTAVFGLLVQRPLARFHRGSSTRPIRLLGLGDGSHSRSQTRNHSAAAQVRESAFKKLADQGDISGHATQEKILERVEQERDLAALRENLTVLTASVPGVMQQLAIHTIGGTEAQALMVIAPEGTQVTTGVTLENKVIDFLNVDKGAEIKLETFPYTRYGTVQASVDGVTADAVNDEKRGAIFPVTLV